MHFHRLCKTIFAEWGKNTKENIQKLLWDFTDKFLTDRLKLKLGEFNSIYILLIIILMIFIPLYICVKD